MTTSLPIDSFRTITLPEMQDVKLMNRTDTKYIIPIGFLPSVLESCKGSYFLQKSSAGGTTEYRTLYFDTPGHDSYLLHLHGREPRQKLRTRIYEDTGDAFFEIKTKGNKGRTKKRRAQIEVVDFENFLANPDARDLAKNKSRWDCNVLSPSVEIHFSRLTLVNYDKTERVTIDYQLNFLNSRNGASASLPEIAILELKRDGRKRSLMQDILLQMRIFPTRFSKYCTGLMLTDKNLPKGRFKLRLIQLNKLIDKYA